MKQETKRVLTFTGLTIAISWLLVVVFFIFGGEAGSGKAGGISAVYVLIPGIIAIYMQKYLYGEPLRQSLAIYFKPNRWFFAAWGLAILLIFAVKEVGFELPWHEYSPEMDGYFATLSRNMSAEKVEQIRTALDAMPFPFFWVILIQGLIGGVTIGALVAMGEELGFRGFLQRQFSSMGFWRSSAVIGIIWGIWAAPIVLFGHRYPDHTAAGLGMMTVYCLLASPIHSYLRLKSRSVIAPSIFGGTVSSLALIPIMMLAGGSDLTAGITGLAGLLVLAVTDIGILGFEHFLSDAPFSFGEQK